MATITKYPDSSWTVPSGVTSVNVRLKGGDGGSGSLSAFEGGDGGEVEVDLSVSGGDVLYFRGANTGGAGPSEAGDGGDYVDVRYNGTALTDQIAVAAGGGGGGSDENPDSQYPILGGHGGADTGQDSESTSTGGKGGTQSAGGAGGSADTTGGDGIREYGGDGSSSGFGGGGGGGGYYGGGGGAINFTGDDTGGGGGGGSNYASTGPAVVSAVNANTRGTHPYSARAELTYVVSPDGVAIDSLTEPAEGEARMQASATAGYDSGSTWTVYRSTDGSKGSSVHSETGDGGLDWTDQNAPTGDDVYYTAELSNSSGIDSSQQSIKIRAAAISDLAVDATRDAEIDISWTDSTDPEVNEYGIYRAEASGTNFVDYSEIATVAGTPYTDTGLENGEQYYYVIEARDSADAAYDSRISNEAVGTTDLPAPTIAATAVNPTIDVPAGTTETIASGATVSGESAYYIAGAVEIQGNLEVQ